MSDYEMGGDDRLLAIPRLAERVGVTPRVLRYWEEQGLISPTREHGRLRYSPRDVAIARLIRTGPANWYRHRGGADAQAAR